MQSLADTNMETIDCQDVSGGTLVYWSVVSQKLETLEALVKAGADVNIPNFSKI